MARVASASVLVASAVLFSSGQAWGSDDCLVELDGVALGFLLPDRGCKTTVLTDVQLSAATTNWTDFAIRGTAEAGAMWAIPDHQAAHVGAMLAVSGTDSYDDSATTGPSVDIAPLLRARYWLSSSAPSLVVDAAAGPAFVIPTGDALRYGGYFELGASLHGAVGVFVGVEPTVSAADQTLQTRYAIGAKTTALGVLIILSIYACSQTSCL